MNRLTQNDPALVKPTALKAEAKTKCHSFWKCSLSSSKSIYTWYHLFVSSTVDEIQVCVPKFIIIPALDNSSFIPLFAVLLGVQIVIKVSFDVIDDCSFVNLNQNDIV